MSETVYHRRISGDRAEEVLVRASGELWGKAPRLVAGNGPRCVKAFLGPLPKGVSGYTFMTDAAPSRTRMFMGTPGAVWEDGSPGVEDVEGHGDFVRIRVRVDEGSF